MNDAAIQKLSLTKRQRHTVSSVSVSTGTTFKSEESVIAMSKMPRFVKVIATDGDVLVELGTAVSAPATPGTGSERVAAGASGQWFQCPTGGSPWATVTAVSGTVATAVIWGL